MAAHPKRRALLVVVFVLIVLTGAWFYRQSATQKPGPAGPRRAGGPRGGPGARQVTVSLTKAEIGEVRERLLLTGALKPKEQVDVIPKLQGRVQRILVHVGDQVRVGQLIAELERDELEQQVRRAEAAIQVARAALTQREAELANAEAKLRRAEALRADGLIASQDFEAQKTSTEVVRAQVRLTRAQLEQAEAELRELKIRLAQTYIHAPINGQVAARYVDVGSLAGPSTPLVRIVNLSTMVTAANVPERELGKLRVGNVARVQVDAFGDQVFLGRIVRIGPVLDAATRSATVEIEIPNPANLLKAEMFARVELDLGTTRRAVLIPRDALVYRGQQPGVYLVEGERPVFRPIETGLTQGDKVEVLANLLPGTEIIGAGASMIAEGDRIVIVGRGGRGPRGPASGSSTAGQGQAAAMGGRPTPRTPATN